MADKFIYTDFKLGKGIKSFKVFGSLKQVEKDIKGSDESVEVYKIDSDTFKEIQEEFRKKYEDADKIERRLIDLEFIDMVMDNATYVKEY